MIAKSNLRMYRKVVKSHLRSLLPSPPSDLTLTAQTPAKTAILKMDANSPPAARQSCAPSDGTARFHKWVLARVHATYP